MAFPLRSLRPLALEADSFIGCRLKQQLAAMMSKASQNDRTLGRRVKRDKTLAESRSRSESLGKSEPPLVAVLVATSTGWGRRLISGIANYADKHGPWHLWTEPRGFSEAMHLPRGWDGDGVIARIHTQSLADELLQSGLPLVNVSSIELDRCPVPCVTTNYASSARMAVEHFLNSGYQQFAYVGALRRPYVLEAAKCFEEAVHAAKAECRLFDYAEASMSGSRWPERRRRLGDWLVSLPKPIGIYSWASSAGAHVLDVCRYRGIVVPDEVAVLGGDDDPLQCNTTSPTLSSIVVASEKIGYRAAERLDRMMRGEQDTGEMERIEPLTLSIRGSTDALAISDEELRRAVIYLRRHAYRPLNVSEVADAVPMARRSLERRFRRFFERTPAEEIRRLRIERARSLLATTDLSVAEIASATGYATPTHLSVTFRNVVGVTPLRFRSQVRGR